jgi:hypothetical protein
VVIHKKLEESIVLGGPGVNVGNADIVPVKEKESV